MPPHDIDYTKPPDVNHVCSSVKSIALPYLSERHWSDLRGSGLSDEAIAQCGIRTLDAALEANRILHRKGNRIDKRIAPCLVFPYFTVQGKLDLSFARLKPDAKIYSLNELAKLTHGKKARPAKYLSPDKSGIWVYFPPLPVLHKAIEDPAGVLYFTEGEKKAIKLNQEGFPTIGLGGVEMWRREKGSKELNHDLQKINWKNRKVYIIFDSNTATNFNVERAEGSLARALMRAGAVTYRVRLPHLQAEHKPGPHTTSTGADDFLVAQGAAALHALIEKTKPDPSPTEREAVARLQAQEHEAAWESQVALQRSWQERQRLKQEQARLFALPRRQNCGFVLAFNQKNFVLLLKTRCGTWGCQFCRAINSIEWLACTAAAFTGLESVWLGTCPDNLRERGNLSRRLRKCEACFRTVNASGTVLYFADREVLGFQRFTPAEALERFRSTLALVTGTTRRPIGGCRCKRWQLPKPKSAGKFKLMARGGCKDLQTFEDILLALDATQAPGAGIEARGTERAGYLLAPNTYDLARDSLAVGEVLPKPIAEILEGDEGEEQANTPPRVSLEFG